MKLVETPRNVTRSGDFQETGFKIAATAKMFDILSARIYTDVPLAIVRELSTNAHDAQVAAGNADTPFFVHLPNSLESWLEIRDYGTGLSPEDVESIFTVYGASTRDDSDEFAGCLGLGSKSPFAYTDQFTVTSFLDGTARTYSLFKNEAGAPSIALMLEAETDEPNGVSIKINIQQHNISDFVNAAHRVYRFFKVRPNIVGANMEWHDTPVAETDAYQLFEGRESGLRHSINVVMGQVCYAVPHIRRGLGYNARLVVFMDMGTCSFPPSREELRWDEHTSKNVEAAVAAAIDDIKTKLEAKTKTEKTGLLRKVAVQRNAHILDIPAADIELELHEKDKYTLSELQLHRDRLYIEGGRGTMRAQTECEYVFMVDDVDNADTVKWKRRIKHWFQRRLEGHNHCTGKLRVFLAKIEDAAAFTAMFGETVGKVSDLPVPPRKPREPGDRIPRSYVKQLTSSSRQRLCDNWDNAEFEDDDEKVFAIVPRDTYYAVTPAGHTMRPEEVRLIAQAIGVDVVYGITKSQYEKQAKKADMPNLFELAKDWVEAEVAKMDDIDRARYHGLGGSVSMPGKLLANIAGLSDICDNLIAYLNRKDLGRAFRTLVRVFKIDIPVVEGYHEAFKQRYPLLNRISYWYDDGVVEDAVEYIKLKERSKNV